MKYPLALALVALSSTAMAEEASRWSAGIGVIQSPSPYIGVDNQNLVFPAVGYEGKDFYLRGPSAGYYLAKDELWSLALGLQLGPSRLDPDKSDDQRMKRLDDRKFSVLGGVRATHKAKWGLLEGTLATDVSGRHDGQYAELAYKYPVIRNARFQLTPGLGLAYYSDDYADYYYGVSGGESLRSGFAEYHPGSATNSFATLDMNWKFASQWLAVASLRYTWLDDSLSDSPIVDKDHSTSAYLGLVYRF
ncbi:MAG: MipA/OmpV family protein [Pseudomonadota bacterium]|uniref:MipA/OmpV family protein n=1 Tax=Gallaecimonas pentaromativorans TaxID=584787 RepID=UPI00067F2D30|nr:MipA/OmpV family protein [Gallaecimonas pentaromativorans]MED5526756.1 MipA/OmpV family protein [Pseudomonadota bacterium]